MRQYKGYTEGASFKGVMKFTDILEMQNKAVSCFQKSDSGIQIYSGMNLTLSDKGITVTKGILLWGGFPATFEEVVGVNLDEIACIVVYKVETDPRDVIYESGEYSYFAYSDFVAEFSSKIPELGEDYNDGVVVSVLPLIFQANDAPVTLLPTSEYEGESRVIEYGNKPAYLINAGYGGVSHYVMTQGSIFGSPELADELNGVFNNSIVTFGDQFVLETKKIEFDDAIATVEKVTSDMTIQQMLTQIAFNLNSLKKVAYTSDYADLERKLRYANDLIVNLDDVIFTGVPSSGSLRRVLSLVSSVINHLSEAAKTGDFNDLENKPSLLSQINNDLIIPEELPVGSFMLVLSSAKIPAGWAIADGTNGTLNLNQWLPDESISRAYEDLATNTDLLGDSEGEQLQVISSWLIWIQKVSSGRASFKAEVVNGNGRLRIDNSTVAISSFDKNALLGTEVRVYFEPIGENEFSLATLYQYEDGQIVNTMAYTNVPYVDISIDSDSRLEVEFTSKYRVLLEADSPGDGLVSYDDVTYAKSTQCYVDWGDHMMYASVLDGDDYYLDEVRKYKDGHDDYVSLEYEVVLGRYQITALIDSDCRVVAIYKRIPKLTVDINPNDCAGYEVSAQPPYRIGQEIEVLFTPYERNRYIKSYYTDSEGIHQFTENPVRLVFSEEDIDLNADFQIIRQVNVETANGNYGLISVNGSEASEVKELQVLNMESIHVVALPSQGYMFTKWSSVDASIESVVAESDLLIKKDATIIAYFAKMFCNVVASFDPAKLTVSGAGTYDYGETIVLEASLNAGVRFLNWTMFVDNVEQVIGVDPVLELTANRNYHVYANVEMIEYSVRVSGTPASYGEVTGSGQFNYGDAAIIEAIPAIYRMFTGWFEGSVMVSNQAKYRFSVLRDRYLEAKFEKIPKTITISVDPNNTGTVSGAGTFFMGDLVEVSVDPLTGYKFLGWYKGNVLLSEALIYKFRLLEDLALIAKLEAILVWLHTKALDSNIGQTTGEGKYLYGSTVTAIAYGRVGYVFESWIDQESGDVVSTDEAYTFSIFKETTLIATFVPALIHINAISSNSNYGRALGTGDYEFNTTASVKATPFEGYEFDGWYIDDVRVTKSLVYSFTVTEAINLIAKFKK